MKEQTLCDIPHIEDNDFLHVRQSQIKSQYLR